MFTKQGYHVIASDVETCHFKVFYGFSLPFLFFSFQKCCGTISFVVEHSNGPSLSVNPTPLLPNQPQQEFMVGEMEMEHSFLPTHQPPDYPYLARIKSGKSPTLGLALDKYS